MAIDDRLTSLKTDTFSKTREEKMEDLFAQKDVGLDFRVCPDHHCLEGLFEVTIVFVC